MKDKFIHGLSATIVITIGILIGCSDNVSDAPEVAIEKILELVQKQLT